MARPLALAAGLALLLACKLDPGGRCVFDSQCSAGLTCSSGMCVVRDAGADLGASCTVDSDCVSGGMCRENACVLAPGACVANGDCLSWQACGTDHHCALAAGKCSWNADCDSWKTCNLSSYSCTLLPGRCDTAANCKTWQTCDATNTCLAKPGFCDLASQCLSWQTCDTKTTHTCTVNTTGGYCDAGAQCQAWQTCDTVATHRCAANTAGGFCDADAQCQGWEACDVAATHTCVAVPGRCATTADCGPFRTCQSNLCVSPDGTDVLLCGELTAGDFTTFALSLVGDAATPTVGFAANFGQPRLDAYGHVLYVDPRWNGSATVDTLVRFAPDDASLTFDGTIWHYPGAPTANDVVVPTPNCTGNVIQRWIVRGGTGEVFHSCDPDVWYDVDGNARFTEPTGTDLVAWNAADAKLVVAALSYSVVDPAGAVHALTGLPSVGMFYAARTSGAGFWLALQNATTGDDELYGVDETGAATLVGAYPALAGGVWALDDSGRAYTFAGGKILRRAVGATAEESLYDMAGGTSDWRANPAKWWVEAAGPVLVTGP